MQNDDNRTKVEWASAGHLQHLLLLRQLLHAAHAMLPPLEKDQGGPEVEDQFRNTLRPLRQIVRRQGDAKMGRIIHLGEPSQGTGRVEQFVDDSEANGWLIRQRRAGFELG